nr:MAG TPA: hypothetical protein [Caudoviricetes sp.]
MCRNTPKQGRKRKGTTETLACFNGFLSLRSSFLKISFSV